MDDPCPFGDTRQGRLLAELAGLSIRAARNLSDRLEQAESAEDAAKLANALDKVSRSVRRTLALEVRLIAEDRRLLREEAPDRERQRKVQIARRRDHLFTVLERAMRQESSCEAETQDWLEWLDEVLAEETTLEGFADEPLDDQVARLRLALNMRARSDDEVAAEAEAAVEPPADDAPVATGRPDAPAESATPKAALPLVALDAYQMAEPGSDTS